MGFKLSLEYSIPSYHNHVMLVKRKGKKGVEVVQLVSILQTAKHMTTIYSNGVYRGLFPVIL